MKNLILQCIDLALASEKLGSKKAGGVSTNGSHAKPGERVVKK